jgi:prepilin-type N-terminal cleavage/methylation domain-containing protein
MKISATSSKGFTLVELAIVLMIIGLLIGGILKGQELITNARIASSQTQVKAISAALITFQDSYGVLPGDITNPGTRLPSCATSFCTMAGNGNGMIGTVSNYHNDELNASWLHMNAAGLLSGINADASWTSASTGFFVATAPMPKFKMAGRVQMLYLGANWNYLAQLSNSAGYYLHSIANVDDEPTIQCGLIARYDIKFDDGLPNTGSVLLHPAHARGTGNTYLPNQTGLCTMLIGLDM